MSRTWMALAVAYFMWRPPVLADDVVIDYSWKGQVNKGSINGKGKLTISKDGKLKAEAEFTQFPTTFSPSVLDFSLLSTNCIIGETGGTGLQVLLEKQGDHILCYRSFVIEDDAGKNIGAITLSGTLEKVGDNKYSTSLELNGHYAGPTKDINVGDYGFDLVPVAKGRLAGSFEGSFEADGKKYRVHVATEYNHTGSSKIAKPIAFGIEYGKGKASSFDGKLLRFTGTRTLTEK